VRTQLESLSGTAQLQQPLGAQCISGSVIRNHYGTSAPIGPNQTNPTAKMSEIPVIRTELFSDAASFLKALHPASDLWSPRSEMWIYRGHCDASWKLAPSAFRERAFAQFDSSALGHHHLPENARSATEMLVLRKFCEGLDRSGLPIPGLTGARLNELRPETPGSLRWPQQHVELAALAQHHGIPTRLLDFTTSGLVAAYFAAQPHLSEEADELAVWAVHRGAISHGARSRGIWFEVLRAGRSENPNLHAQSGVFVTWTGSEELLCLDQIVMRLASGEIELRTGELALPRPAMHKLVLPRRHASELLGRLVDERITGATMFPGVDGVVRALREQAFHRRFEVI
jgi:hypothetical protein